MKNYDVLRGQCRRMYLMGMGNYWGEEGEGGVGSDRHLRYRLYTAAVMVMYLLLTGLEILAAMFGDYSEEEQKDSVSLSVGNFTLILEIIFVMMKKNEIKELNKRMIEVCAEHEEWRSLREQYAAIKRNMVVFFAMVYSSVSFYVIGGLRKLFSGSQYVAIVTYYPRAGDASAGAVSARVLATVCAFHMMATMVVCVNALAFIHIIMYKYKFITLRKYFEKLGRDVESYIDMKNESAAYERLHAGLNEGLQMHADILRLCPAVEACWGRVLACHLCVTLGAAVPLLLLLALSSELEMMSVFKIVFFISALFFLLGLFLCNAGEITYQASLVCGGVYACGWHCGPASHRATTIRHLMCAAIAQAQKPVHLKAFNMVELTYSTLIWVLKTTYSMFTLLYAQNQ